MRVRMALAAAAALAAGGCGDSTPSLSMECTQGASPLSTALRNAPGNVVLGDGTRLSDCLRRATGEADLQEVAAGETSLADRLAKRAPGDEAAAVQLGYLIGAARRGARHTAGLDAELVRRLEAAAVDVPASRQAAFQRGISAGARNG